MIVKKLAFLRSEDFLSPAISQFSTPLLVRLHLPLAVGHHVHGVCKAIVFGEDIDISTAAL